MGFGSSVGGKLLGSYLIRGANTPVGGIVTLVYDTFTDSDSTSLDVHTIAPTNTPGTSWTEVGGNFSITSNQAVTAANSEDYASCDPAVADCTLSGDASSNAVAAGLIRDTGVMARGDGSIDGWKIGINATGNTFRIVEKQGASRTSRAAASVTINAGTEYSIQAVLLGQSISGTLDGANDINYGSAAFNQAVTTHGIFVYRTDDTADEFKVEA